MMSEKLRIKNYKSGMENVMNDQCLIAAGP